MSTAEIRNLLLTVTALGLAALLPLSGNGYLLSIGVTIAMYTVLATSWSLFSGPTRYISLATGAFYGIGTYVVALGVEHMPYPVLLVIALVLGAFAAGLVGMATLRLSGVYFVIFTLGLAEMIRQIVTWVQNNWSGHRGLYVLTDITEEHIYWELLAAAAAVFLVGWLIGRSRLGFAMRVIGNDETVAAHCGINTSRAKIFLFMISGMIASLVGALMAPRWTYIEPALAFSPLLSFQVVIMALLGGTNRLWGPLVGVVPFTLLWEAISIQFPNQTTLLLGVAFLLIVYAIPHGILGRLESVALAWTKERA